MAKVAVISNLAVLHPFAVSKQAGNTAIHLIQSIALLGGFIIALLGLFLVIGTLNWQRKILQKVIAVLIFGQIIALTSAIANVIQNEVTGVLSGNIWGMLIGGAVGGIVAGCGGAVIQGLGRASPSQLALLGAAFIIGGFFIEFLVIGIIFMV